MSYSLRADLMVVGHALFVCFVVFGGVDNLAVYLLVWQRHRKER